MPFSRLELLLNPEDMAKLRQAHVLILGVGGVGSWAAEMLARSAIGHLTLVDCDIVKPSNINRQILALHSTLGKDKVTALGDRLLDINPMLEFHPIHRHLAPEDVPELLDSTHWDCVIDAIDERPSKLAAILHCLKNGIPILSSMGSANKLDPSAIQITDIANTIGCPLAKLIRKSLHREGILGGLTVCFSPELPVVLQTGTYHGDEAEVPGEKKPLGTISYVPALFGIRLAAEAIAIIRGIRKRAKVKYAPKKP